MTDYPHETDRLGRDVHLPTLALTLMDRLETSQLTRLVRMLSVLAVNRDRHDRGVMRRLDFDALLDDSRP